MFNLQNLSNQPPRIDQSNQQQQPDYTVKLTDVTRQNHHDDPVTLAFKVQSPGEHEQIITTELYSNDLRMLFELCNEGQQWLNNQRSRGATSIRREQRSA